MVETSFQESKILALSFGLCLGDIVSFESILPMAIFGTEEQTRSSSFNGMFPNTFGCGRANG